jgi:hypothetical protein
MNQMNEVRDEITRWGYATPVVAPHLQSALGAVASGASNVLDPFRSSLPDMYRMPAWIADGIALRSDWSILGMDYWRVLGEIHGSAEAEQQESLFDPNDFVR